MAPNFDGLRCPWLQPRDVKELSTDLASHGTGVGAWLAARALDLDGFGWISTYLEL